MYIVELKNPRGRGHTCHKASENIMGGESASSTNPNKVRTDKYKTKYADRLEDMSTGD